MKNAFLIFYLIFEHEQKHIGQKQILKSSFFVKYFVWIGKAHDGENRMIFLLHFWTNWKKSQILLTITFLTLTVLYKCCAIKYFW